MTTWEITDAGREALSTATRLTRLEMVLAYLGGLPVVDHGDGTFTINGTGGYGGPLPDALIAWGDTHLGHHAFWPPADPQ